MKVEQMWYGTTLKPENMDEIRILNELWQALLLSEKRNDNDVFSIISYDNNCIFINSGE